MADNELLIKINADAKNAEKAFDDIRSQTEDLEGTLTSIAKGSAIAFAALTAEVGLAAHAYEESEQASRKLTITLQNQGIYSKALQDSYKGQAEELQKLTGFDDDKIVKGQALLQNFIGQRQVTEELTRASLELAEANGGNVEAGFESLGRALQGNTRALKQYGIVIEEGLTSGERYSRVLEQISLKLGGQAEAANKGLGSIRGLKSAFSDFQEAIGQKFAPIIEKAITFVTKFFQAAAKNQGLIDLAAAVIGAGIAISGIVALITAAIPVFLAASAAATVFGTTLAVALGPVTLIAAGIVAIGAAVGYYVSQSNKAGAATEALDNKIALATTNLENARKRLDDPIARFFSSNVDKEYEEKKAQLEDLQERKRKLDSSETAKSRTIDVDPAKKAVADKEEAQRLQRQRLEEKAQQAHLDVLRLQNEHASEELIAIKQKEAETLKALAETNNAEERELLQAKYEELKALEADQRAQDQESAAAFREEDLALKAENQAADTDADRAYREQKNAELLADTIGEKEAERKVEFEKAQTRLAARNTEALERKKFGAAYALINKTLHSEEVQGVKNASAELVDLQNSKNATLKAIGKAAAITQIVIGTAEAALNIYRGFATIPIVGPALGIAGAAAAVAFGAEKIQRVNSAADGALVEGGIPGRDSVPFLLEPGELVVPKRNFNDVVGAVKSDSNQTDPAMLALLTSIDQKFTQPSQTIIQGDVMADSAFIDVLIAKISDRLQYGNAQLVGASGVL